MTFKTLICSLLLGLLIVVSATQAISIVTDEPESKHPLCHSFKQLDHSQCFKTSSWWYLP